MLARVMGVSSTRGASDESMRRSVGRPRCLTGVGVANSRNAADDVAPRASRPSPVASGEAIAAGGGDHTKAAVSWTSLLSAVSSLAFAAGSAPEGVGAAFAGVLRLRWRRSQTLLTAGGVASSIR